MNIEKNFSPVLVVDDEPLVLKQISEAVSEWGYVDVRGASGFEQALEILKATRIGVLITDVVLPDGDGRRLASQALKDHTGIVILMSSFSAQTLMLAPELRAQTHLLEKPFSMQDLRELLTKITAEQKSKQP